MKVLETETIFNNITDYNLIKQFNDLTQQVHNAILSIKYPPGADGFYLFDEKKSNGVKPIKDAFVETLNNYGWLCEKHQESDIKKWYFDTVYALGNEKYFAVEWETGNISSSHRALNRISLGILEKVVVGGYLILPSFTMYKYLTDRVGNIKEMEKYLDLWRVLGENETFNSSMLGIIIVEHDGVRNDIPPIKKGTDGRALL